MIAYLRGIIVDISENAVVVDVHDIGYRVFVSTKDAQVMPSPGNEVRIHTYLNVKEDAMLLFGFLSSDDLAVFKLLLNVSGIGPKAALGVLSSLSADDLRFAVLSDDVKIISSAPGIGKKTAQKLILELKDKFSLENAFEKRMENNGRAAAATGVMDAAGEAVQALTALGYSGTDALKAVKKVEISDDMSTEDILKAALKHISII